MSFDSPITGGLTSAARQKIEESAMAAKDLCTLTRAYQNIQGQTLGGPYDSLIATLITTASDAIAKYCRRDFYVRSYDELYSGNGERRLLLREYPIQSVKSVRYRPVTVLKIINNTPSNTQARVQVTSTGITLTWTDNTATAQSSSKSFAGNATLAAMSTAINAIGSGWSAQAVGDTGGDYGLWPSADLYVPPSFGDGTTSQGNLTARGVFAELKLHTYELAGYQFDPRGWLLRAIPYTDPELLHPEDLIFPPGINNFRVQYSAGYTTIPESVQQACAMWTAMLFFQVQRDPQLLSQSLPGSISQSWNTGDPTTDIKNLLAPYRRYTISS
jgi:hypothetical protein